MREPPFCFKLFFFALISVIFAFLVSTIGGGWGWIPLPSSPPLFRGHSCPQPTYPNMQAHPRVHTCMLAYIHTCVHVCMTWTDITCHYNTLRTDRQTDQPTDRQTQGRTDRRTGRQTDRHTHGQTDRQADRRTHIHTRTHTSNNQIYIHAYMDTYIHDECIHACVHTWHAYILTYISSHA